MFLSLLSYRLTNLTGEIHNLTYLEGNHIKDYTKNHQHSIIFFTDKPNLLYFTKYAINIYKNISFARSSARDGKGYGCNPDAQYPCVVPFLKGRKIKDATHAPISGINFTRWCKQVFDGHNHYIEHPEALRQVLETEETVVIGVGVEERPEWIPKKFHFFMTNSKVFENLKIKVENGIYSYSAKDRTMHEISESEKHDFGVYVSNLLQEKTYNKKFWGGFALNPQNATQNQLEFEIMNEIGKKYSNSINLAPLYDEWGWKLVREGRIIFFDVPFFFVFESRKNMSNRWIITNYTLSHDKDYVDNFVRGIINGSEKYTVVSEPPPTPTRRYMKTLTLNTFWETVDSNYTDVLVIFASKECENCLKPYLIVNKTASLLRENKIRVFSYNCSLNEIPVGLHIEQLPTIALFRKGKDPTQPLVYKGNELTEDLITWVKEQGTDRLDVPPFDIDKVRQDIANEYYELAPPVDFVVTKTETTF